MKIKWSQDQFRDGNVWQSKYATIWVASDAAKLTLYKHQVSPVGVSPIISGRDRTAPLNTPAEPGQGGYERAVEAARTNDEHFSGEQATARWNPAAAEYTLNLAGCTAHITQQVRRSRCDGPTCMLHGRHADCATGLGSGLRAGATPGGPIVVWWWAARSTSGGCACRRRTPHLSGHRC
jgi:hypothetical protein